MSNNSPHGMPDPDPTNEVAARLEYVRAEVGFENSKRAFWRALCDGWGEEEAVSYEAALRYHHDRQPPVQYLARVSEVFGFRMEWLATGKKPKTKAADVARRHGRGSRDRATRLLDAVSNRLPGFGPGHLGMSEPQQRQFLQLLVRYVQAGENGDELLDFDGEPPEELLEFAADLHFLVWLPVEARAWGFEALDYRRRDQLNEYVTAMMHALSLWIRERGEWLPVEKAGTSTIRRAREAVEEEEVPEDAVSTLRDTEEE